MSRRQTMLGVVALVSILPAGQKPTAPSDSIASELLALVSRGATTEGTTETSFPGLRFHRVSHPAIFKKWSSFGPSLTVVVQVSKSSMYRGVKLSYDRHRYLVVTGEAEFEGAVTDAHPQRPFLSFCYQLPPELIAKTLLALADASAPPVVEAVPAFVSALDIPIADCVVRMLRACEDGIERRIVAPLVAEELVFRLLRSDAAAAVRSAVGHEQETSQIALAMRFLQANIERPLTVEDVARHVAMSPSHFAHRFRAVARVSPMRYFKHLRLNHARTLMLTHGLRASEAAARAGYESASHFTRDFKTLFGSSPGEYTRRLRIS